MTVGIYLLKQRRLNGISAQWFAGSGTASKPVSPEIPENKESTSDLDSNTGGKTITNQENVVISSEPSQQSKLANLGEQNSIILQGFGLLMVISGIAFFWWKRRKTYILNKQNEYINETMHST
ncbi:LPXTG cell wall anchor domain-containing protein [Listeria innocua]|uniref:LPXTG cell wall anchor domain-containing protein n=1 Tax=Listeria innocua TaxID=1642 RepID=UPI0016290416|nr:LPXTG cell wall anchor domain-containing protein [Listeria innocua]MBC1384744.1 LPXTG cell wall anchor domain-containing protein [Listeria innocua]